MTTRINFVPIAIFAIIVTSISLITAPSANAQASDPVNDFLGTYLGPHAGDLDVLSTGATYDGTNFLFSATLNGAVGATPGGFYVWGVNRGNGAAGFASLGLQNVLFDATVIVRPNGLNPANATANVGANVLPISNISFVGNSLSVLVPATLLLSTGFTPGQYTINLWPRFGGTFNGQNVTGNAAISDFAPNNSNVQVVTTAPEPGSLGLATLGGALLLGGVCARRKR